jgi:hypothetical protein
MRLASKELLFRSPGLGTVVSAMSFYTRRDGLEKLRRRATEIKNDLTDTVEQSWSSDNGKTWSPPEAFPIQRATPNGTYRAFLLPGWVDPVNGRLLTTMIEGVLPNDDALEDGMKHYYLRYHVSLDGGRTNVVDEQAIDKDGRHDAVRPFDGVTVGKNSMMLGDQGSMPLRTRGGSILIPTQVCPVGPDGEYYNPGGGYTYHDVVLLVGRWVNERDGSDCRIAWELSEYVRGDPARSTRGWVEPTLAEMPDGSVLMVMRGSNDSRPELPGHKWYAVSRDEGRTWGPVKPWAYADAPDEPFFSPSSMSLLLTHSSGRYFWLGNICPTNPRGNGPRHPLVIGEVDPRSFLLRRETVTVIDDRQPGESEQMMLSNFSAHEDRATGEIVLHMSRWMAPDWIGDAYVYRIGV